MSDDPKLIASRHNGYFTKDGVTAELCIHRLEHSQWTLEEVDAKNTSTAWHDEFDTDDDTLAEFHRVTADGMLEFQPTASRFAN